MPGKLTRLIALAAIVGGIAGCNSKNVVSTDTNTKNDSGFTFQSTGESDIHTFPAGHRQTVGNVQGETLQGQPISLSQYRGKVVVVSFWASNCAPCDQEARWLRALANATTTDGVQFVGIDERDNRAAGMNFEQSHQLPYPSIFDANDAFVLDFPGAVPATTPFTVVLDRQGQIAAKATDGLDYTNLKEMVEYALGSKLA
jgi:peroxiredoxin